MFAFLFSIMVSAVQEFRSVHLTLQPAVPTPPLHALPLYINLQTAYHIILYIYPHTAAIVRVSQSQQFSPCP